jgi:hypothetical protein
MAKKHIFRSLKIKVCPKGLHKSLTPDPWPLTPVLSTTVERALQINFFMQNKANFRKVKLNVTNLLTKDYDPIDTWWSGKTKPIQSQLKPIKANSKPIQSQLKPIKCQNKPNQSQFVAA